MGPIHEDIHLKRGGKALIDAAGLEVDHSPNYKIARCDEDAVLEHTARTAPRRLWVRDII